MSIKNNLQDLKQSLPEQVTLVAVSKTKPVVEIMEAYDAGQRIFGENKVQELVEKYEDMPKDIEWHMIGHVQTNKIKYMAPFIHMVHSIDRMKSLKELNKQALANERIISCLLQIKIAEEDSKFGMSLSEAQEILQSEAFFNMKNIVIKGVMGMATFTEDQEQIETEFKRLKSVFTELKPLISEHFQPEIISMGMSGDYALAIECGSTMIRVGSHIFGSR